MNTDPDHKQPFWFENWFDSEYYHLLYNNRNYAEAELFISNLIQFLQIPAEANVLDLGCGKGRHSIYLHSKGLHVLGVDLSANSIQSAKAFETKGLKFQVGDMREPQGNAEFDYVFNLFTSFGYFESEEENMKTINAISTSLKPGGILVLDFMNAEKIKSNLKAYHEIEKDGIAFKIYKTIENNVISKKISFSDQGKPWFFEERVQALEQDDFRKYFKEIQLKELTVFGDYNLNSFSRTDSDRLIFVVRKAD